MKNLLLAAVVVLAACDPGTSSTGRYHPSGWSSSSVHGQATRLGEQDCTTCHGEQLDGDGSSGVSCDDCHEDGWRTNCNFCHGGDENDSGAPPRGLNDAVDPSTLAFSVHSIHVTGDRHPAFGCEQCHVQPEDVLTSGHLFDSTPGKAEVSFDAGLSARTAWDGNGGCSNSYCHGNGRADNGSVTATDSNLACNTCHASSSIGFNWLQMSGEHAKHLWKTVGCEDCHAAVVDGSDNIVGPDLHVNGTPDIQFSTTAVTMSGGRCTGACHGENHNNAGW